MTTLENYSGEMETCCRCSSCKFIPLERITSYDHANVCPSISRYNFHAYSGGGRMGSGIGLLRGRVECDTAFAELVYNCNLCGACDVSCKYAMDMDVLEPLYAIRREVVSRGQTLPAVDKMVAGMQEGGPFLANASAAGPKWYEGLSVKDYLSEKTSVIFHAGCLANHDAEAGRTAALAVSLLTKAGIDVGIAKQQESCCGGRAYQMGYEDAARGQAEKNLKLFKQSQAEVLVTSCAHCYEAFKVLYAKLGLDTGLKVMHVTEYLAELISDGRLKPSKPLNMRVTYHDPCHLGRLSEPWVAWEGLQREQHMRVYDPPREFRRGTNGVYDAPRDILRAIPGLELLEMDRTREYAWCCGAGGGVRETNPEFAKWTASERLCEAESCGAEAVVTACPHCEGSFRDGLEGKAGVTQVYDVVELLNKAL